MSDSSSPSPSRRAFLRNATALAAGVASGGCTRSDAPSKTPARLGAPWPSAELPDSLQKGAIAFPSLEGGSCPLVMPMTLGPCTTQTPITRANVSEGWPGLTLQLELRLVDSQCRPVQGAALRIWHTNHEGSYSGQTPANDFCVFKPEYLEQNFFRGAQRSDDQGIVRFLTKYPGWYPGRAIHIHVQAQAQGRSSRATQIYFPQALNDEVFKTHSIYRDHKMPDTSNADDSILGTATKAQQRALTLDITRDDQHRLFAHKTLALVDLPEESAP